MTLWDLDQQQRAKMEVRFLARVDVGTSPAGCWLWTGRKFYDGYSSFSVGTKRRQAHRVAYELFVGPIPEGLQLDHLCRERECVNPLHLDPVTPRENKRRGKDNQNSIKTHCIHGHPFDEKNTYVCARGWRYCRACAYQRLCWRRRAKRAKKT